MDNYYFKNDVFKYDPKLTDADLKSIDNLYNYQSPIELIANEMQTKYEDDCVSVCQSYGFNVNKEELKKALDYDRDQYNKGYEAGYTAALSEYLELRHAILKLLKVEKDNAPTQQGKWRKIFENPFTNGYVCPFCGHKIQVTEQFLPQVTECEVCGAELKGEGE